jgi:hypothetical protein
MLDEQVPLTDEMFAIVYDLEVQEVRHAFKTLEQFGMIEFDEAQVLRISNWEKHQNIEGMEQAKLLRQARNQRYQEKKKQLEICANNKTSYKTVDKTRKDVLDIDIDIEKDIAQIDIQFTEFWNLYPNKKDRKRSYEKFKSAVKKHGFEKVIEGTKGYIKECELNRTEKQYIKHGATFLHGECYLNDYVVTTLSSEQPRRPLMKGIGD